MNPYYNGPADLPPFSRARIEAIVAELVAIREGFDAVDVKMIADGIGIYRQPTGFMQLPVSQETLGLFAIPVDMTFPPDFADNEGRIYGTIPASAFTVSIKLWLPNGTSGGIIGTRTYNTNGTITRTTTGGTAKALLAGSAIEEIAPVTPQNITNVAEIYVAAVD